MLKKITERQKYLLTVAFIILLIIAGNIAYKRYQLYQFKQQALQFCDIQQGPCSATLAADQTMQLSASPTPIKLSQNITFRVTLKNISAKNLTLFITNENPTLDTSKITMHKISDNEFSGRGQFKDYPDAKPQWQVLVKFNSAIGNIAVPFKLIID